MNRSLNQLLKPQNKWHQLPLLIAMVGVLLFLLISFVAPLREGLFSHLFSKPSSHAASQASISLPSTVTANTSQTIAIPVMINTDSQDIAGVDIRATYNLYYLKLVDITPHPENSSLKTFTPEDSMKNFDKQTVINNANSTGLISLGALALSNGQTATFNGTLSQTNPLVDLTFQPIHTGSTYINVVFTSGSTTDANLVTTDGQDLLQQVTDTAIAIQSSGATPTPTPIPTPTSTPSSTPTVVPTPTPTLILGDLDGNGKVDIFDLSRLLSGWGTNNSSADINKDGVVNIFDLSILLAHWS